MSSDSVSCVISEKDLQFKKLSLISCKNIISLMDVSFQVRGQKWLCFAVVQTLLEWGPFTSRIVFFSEHIPRRGSPLN